MDYHLLDDKHIEILAGDISRGFWNFADGFISRDGETDVKLKQNTKSLNVRKKQKVNNLDTLSELPASNFVGLALAVVLGPAGGLAGHALGAVTGRQEFVCIGAELLDGRKFIARMRSTVYAQWNKLCETKN